jgi:O-antigen/teichoic acid export membrane protein
VRMRIGIVWGFLDQAISSVTNFGLFLLVGRWFGPGRLGVVSVGFAAYVLCLVLYRALLSSPLVVASGSEEGGALRTVTGRGIAASLMLAGMASLTLLLLGFAIPGDIGSGLLLFAPWVGPALVQDAWRSILFRDSRGAAAALNDAVWLGVMLACLPLAWGIRSEWVVVSSWGLGSTAGAAVGFLQTHYPVSLTRASWRWWRTEIWPMGKWFGLDRVVLTVGTQGSILLLANVLDARAIGGLRAVQSVFTPLSLLGPAIVLPGLPAVEHALRTSKRDAWRVAMRLTALITLVALGYVIVVGVWGNDILSALFGRSFLLFRSLTLPIAVGQVFLAAGVGLVLLLQASRKGSALLVSRAVGALLMLGSAWTFARTHGIVGAAWGLAMGSLVTVVCLYAYAWPFSRATDAPSLAQPGSEPG